MKMKLEQLRFVAIALVLFLVVGCPHPALVTPDVPAPIRGQVDFSSSAQRATQASLTEVANASTVSLIDAGTGITAATTRTDTSGAFLMQFSGGFRPATGSVYYIEALKGLIDQGSASNRVGAHAARVRTLMTWQNNGWTSLTSSLPGGVLVVNDSTTALSGVASLRALPVASMSALIGTVSLGTPENSPAPSTRDSFAASAANGIATAEFHTVCSLVDDLLSKDLDPLGNLSYSNGIYTDAGNHQLQITDFRSGAKSNVAVAEAGYAQLAYAVPPAPVPGSANEEAYFPAASVASDAVGVVACDGTYLYAKSWGGYANSDGNAYVFKKIGTGFNGTNQGQNYGTIGNSTWNDLTAGYWGGYVFNPGGTNNQLQRINTTTGVMDTVTTQDALLTRSSASTTGGLSYLFTTDGTYAYSAAYSLDGSGYNGFRIRVLDPANNFALVRELVTDTSTSSYYTDGFVCDGIYLYPLEWSATSGARLRRYRLIDGQKEAEWTFSQSNNTGTSYSATDNGPIQGQYDGVNNKYWIGNLTNQYIHRIKGGTFQTSGTYTSAPFDTGKPSRYRAISWGGDFPAGTSATFQVRTADTAAGLSSASWYGPTSTSDFYTTSGQPINAALSGHEWVQIQATLNTTNAAIATPRLRSLKVLYQ